MELHELLNYDRIVIQCHDDPDADAFASGFALYCWLREQGKSPRFIYGGQNGALKPNLQSMKDLLGIPAEHVTELEAPDLLIMADCQYGEKNARQFPAGEICVIDHHQVRDPASLPEKSEVMESFGACATVVYGMLRRAGYDLAGNTALQTAMLYGLYMDTGQFQELWHPADKDMRDALQPDENILNILKNSNIASSDLYAIGRAFASHTVEEAHRFAVTRVETRDRNILGIVSDTLLQVDCIDVCVVYARIGDIYRFSARSCIKEVRADELVQAIALGIGSAGGHLRKAAGVIFCDRLPDGGDGFARLLEDRLRDYFDSTDTVKAGQAMDLRSFSLYRKKRVEAGAADLNEIFPPDTKVMLRTLEGDIDLTVNKDQLLMIGVSGEAYPIRRDAFEKNYCLTGEAYRFSEDYVPAVRDRSTGRRIGLEGLTRACLSLGTGLVYARKLTRRTHVFTVWDEQKYIFGKPGDWIAVRKDNPADVYIIAGEIFARTYEPENSP